MSIIKSVLIAIFLPIFIFLIFLRFSPKKINHVCIMVLGDVGHSPRMMNHASSFLSHDYTVDFIGYPGSQPPQQLLEDNRIRFHYLSKPQKIMAMRSTLQRLLHGIFRVVRQITSILSMFCFQLNKPQYLMIQNPPAIPTLVVAQAIQYLLGIKLIIDWHNFGYSLMAIDKSVKPMSLSLLEFYERSFGSSAFLHLCVTDAMKSHLQDKWMFGQNIASLFDRPPSDFFAVSAGSSLKDLGNRLLFDDKNLQLVYKADVMETSRMTSFIDAIKNKAFIVTSTSWTEDEDFSILIDALQRYEKRTENNLPDLFVLITGKGPLKDSYMKQIVDLKMKQVTVATAWLKSEDYPKLLSIASLGLSFHVSSSGLDLPMKIVDMFGCGIPALSASYSCIHELVIDGVNGHLFMDGISLEQHLVQLLSDYRNSTSPKLMTLKESLLSWRKEWGNWRDEWDRVVLPRLKDSL